MTLRRHHYRVVYEPRARLAHLEGQSTSRRYRNFLLRHNRDLFVARWKDELAARAGRPAMPDDVAVEQAVHRAGAHRRGSWWWEGRPKRGRLPDR